MTTKFRDEDADFWQGGGGINSRASEDSIDPLECFSGENFELNPGNSEFRPRPPIELLGTVPNGKEIRGFVTLLKTDGSVSMLVQAEEKVYEWNGSDFVDTGVTVAATAKLRGRKEAIWNLADKVLIADLNLQEEIHEWDGTTLSETSFLQADGSTSFPTFRAKYILVDNERAFYGNIYDGASNFPHLLVSSERGNYAICTVSVRPDTSNSDESAWFLPMPQLKAINGIAEAFGQIAFSQESGDFEKLQGTTAKDYNLQKLWSQSGASGDESVVSITNDVVYGAPGRIESLQSTEKAGDVEIDDISFKIQPDIKTYKTWKLVYNQRLRKIYCFPDEEPEVWVCFTDFLGSSLSPWSKYTSQHSFSFLPTACMNCFDPADGLEYVFMGDALGNLYRMEGQTYDGDVGSVSVIAKRKSILFTAPVNAEAFGINGFLEHRNKLENTVTLAFEFSGNSVTTVRKTVPFSTVSYDTPYSAEVYYDANFYYGTAKEDKLVRKKFGVPGKANQWQVEATIEGINDFAVTKVGFRYDFEE